MFTAFPPWFIRKRIERQGQEALERLSESDVILMDQMDALWDKRDWFEGNVHEPIRGSGVLRIGRASPGRQMPVKEGGEFPPLEPCFDGECPHVPLGTLKRQR